MQVTDAGHKVLWAHAREGTYEGKVDTRIKKGLLFVDKRGWGINEYPT
jgi:hypothetical protein